MDVYDIAPASPPPTRCRGDKTFFFRRETGILPSNAEKIVLPGFSPDTVRSMNVEAHFTHEECVNAVSFNSAGTLLATGSDDLYLKIWGSPNFMRDDDIVAKAEIPTGHSANIFHTSVREHPL